MTKIETLKQERDQLMKELAEGVVLGHMSEEEQTKTTTSISALDYWIKDMEASNEIMTSYSITGIINAFTETVNQ